MYRMGCVVFAVLIASSMIARSDIELATVGYTGTGTASGLPSWTPFLSYGDPGDMSPLGYMNNINLSLLDIINGTTYELTGDFANFASVAENDINQSIYVGFFVPGGVGAFDLTTEQDVLATASFLAPGVGTPDFNGYSLTRITVRGTSFSDLGGGDFETSFDFTFYGNQVPEPSTFALMTLGVVALVRRKCPGIRLQK
jgi:hypothetical protein